MKEIAWGLVFVLVCMLLGASCMMDVQQQVEERNNPTPLQRHQVTCYSAGVEVYQAIAVGRVVVWSAGKIEFDTARGYVEVSGADCFEVEVVP